MARERRRKSPAIAVEEEIIVALFDIANHLSRRGEQLAGTIGLTTQQWLMLLEIAGDATFTREGDGASGQGALPSEIASARGVSRATVSVIVAQLEAKELIEQIDDLDDGRRRRLQATARGRAAIKQLDPDRRRANRRLLRPLDGGQRRQFLLYLRQCRAGLVVL